jgi:AraC-like DNA-binding protein
MKIDHVIFDQSVGEKWSVRKSATKHHILFLMLRGKAVYYIGDQVIELHKGNGLFMPEGTIRSAVTDPSDPHLMYSVHFKSSTEELAFLTDEPYKIIQPLGFDYLKQRFSVLYECWVGRMPCYEMITRGILLEILGIIQRELGSKKLSSSKRNLAIRVQQYIVQHYRSSLSLDELSQEVDRTPNYISNVFKEVIGSTPVQYMHQVRINTARELMLTTSMTIGGIADYLGYCDQTYFNYMYKKIVGQPPSFTLKEAEK